MPVAGPAGIFAFYLLSACGYSGLFYRKSTILSGSSEIAKFMAIPLCSIAAFIVFRHLCNAIARRPILPAEQIVMDVKRMNINFTLVGSNK